MIYLREWREAAGFATQGEFVKALADAQAGIGQSAISYYESGGTKVPKLDTAITLVDVLNAGLRRQGHPAITPRDLLAPPPVAVPGVPTEDARC